MKSNLNSKHSCYNSVQNVVLFRVKPRGFTKPRMQRISSRTDSYSAGQEIPRLLWNLKVHKGLPLDPILSHLSQFHIITPHFFNIHFNISIIFTPKSPKSSLLFRRDREWERKLQDKSYEQMRKERKKEITVKEEKR